MNNTTRLQQILAGVLVLQMALIAFIFWPSSAASQSSGPLFANLAIDNVTGLTVSDGDNSLTLAKQDDGWVLPNAGDFPVTAENVTSLLDNVAAISTNRLVTQTDSSHGRLQVADDDFNRKVEITLADGSTDTLFVGSSAGANATHVRAGGQSEVYLAGDVNAFDLNPQAANWIDTLYFTVPQTATTYITLENENGTFDFTQSEGEWTLADLAGDETFNQTAFNSFLGQATSVRMSEPIGTEAQAEFGLDSPAATVTIEADGESYTLQFGPKSEGDSPSYVLKASNSPYYVRVTGFTGDAFTQKTRDNFLEAPPVEEGAGSPDGEALPEINPAE